MGRIFSLEDSLAYQNWLASPRQLYLQGLQWRQAWRMLTPQAGEGLLDIGCGSGRGLGLLKDSGLSLSGIDPSLPMLELAREKMGHKAQLYLGRAEALPFDDNEFTCAIFLNSLEFIETPRAALAEACRVTKDRVVISVFNATGPYRPLANPADKRLQALFANARPFSIWQIKTMLNEILGEVPLEWACTAFFPPWCKMILGFAEKTPLQHLPFGGFLTLRISPVPRFRCRPLRLKYGQRQQRVSHAAG